jgi:Icc-related predicted phosphoesterase
VKDGRLVKGLRRRSKGDGPSLYYASDVHGSDVCWRKFLNAAKFYEADALVMGGDLTGKVIVPITKSNGSYRARFMGRSETVASSDDLTTLEGEIRMNGFYPWIGSPDDVEECQGSEEARARLFRRVLTEEIERWVRIADEKLAGEQTEAWLIPGNDDPWFIDDPLRESERLHFCDGEVVRCCGHEMINLSYSNRTPWDSPRELDEDQLYAKVSALVQQLEAPERAIFNLHVPPYNSGLDTATELDDTLRPVMRGGQPLPQSVGSTAVRQLIEEHQPLLGLHGHIHESRGIAKIGRTTVVNSGSEYNSGQLHGALVQLGADGNVSARLVVG